MDLIEGSDLKMMLYVEGKNSPEAGPFEYCLELPNPDGTIDGRILHVSEEALKEFLGAHVQTSVYTFIPGHKYRVTNLTAKGTFRLVSAPTFDKAIVVGTDRDEHSGVVAPNESIVCGFKGYSDDEVKDFHERYDAGTFTHHTLAGQTYKIV